MLNLARETNHPFNELLQYFAIQRFLFRFSRAPYVEKFVLKGAQMLQAWEAPLARPTMDIDMLGRVTDTIENLESIVRECAAIEVEPDGVEFDLQSVRGEQIVKDSEYQGVRIRLRGALGKIRLSVQLDFGFGDVIVPEPMWVELPDMLGLGAPRMLGYTPESAIAEKFQAMVALNIANTRIKDFYDIWSLSRAREFDGATLAKAIAATFNRRATPLPEEAPLAQLRPSARMTVNRLCGKPFCAKVDWTPTVKRSTMSSASYKSFCFRQQPRQRSAKLSTKNGRPL